MLDALLKKRGFWNVYIAVSLFLAAYIAVKDLEVKGAVLFLFITSAALVVFSDITPAILPVMMLSVFVTDCYDSASVFIKLWYYAIVVAFAVVFHLIKYKRKITVGSSFWGLLAVAVAVTLGGFGTLPRENYFTPTALYYTFSLGIGMVLFYIFFSSHFAKDSRENLAKIMYATGLFAAFCILLFYCKKYYDMVENGSGWYGFQAANNLSTFIMLSMPFPLYFARRRGFDAVVTLIMYVLSMATTSRGALVFATFEIFVIFTVAFCSKNVTRFAKKFFVGLFILFVVAMLVLVFAGPDIIELPESFYTNPYSDTSIIDIKSIFDKSDARIRFIPRTIENFKSNPLFGVGLGYTGNTDLYNPKAGAMNWYHMWWAQIVGGMGILGVICYGYQLLGRIKLYKRKKDPLNTAMFLSYVGLFMMTQVNPGEFCPIPYAVIAVVYFILMEKSRN